MNLLFGIFSLAGEAGILFSGDKRRCVQEIRNYEDKDGAEKEWFDFLIGHEEFQKKEEGTSKRSGVVANFPRCIKVIFFRGFRLCRKPRSYFTCIFIYICYYKTKLVTSFLFAIFMIPLEII
jgi:hypothetical protein